MRNEHYYYSIMDAEHRLVYKRIFEGLKQREETITLASPLPPDEIQEIYLRVLFDTPVFFYVNQTVIRLMSGPGRYILLPEYLYSTREINALTRDIRAVIQRIDAKASALTGDEFRLEKFLHDSVVKSVAYDYDSLKKSDCFNAHSIVGAFLDNKAVCEGIAKAFKLLCNEYHMKCIVVIGKADPKGEFGDDTFHAWNLVKIRDNSYHVDPTWDNLYHEGLQHISYDYFNLTTQEILLDHRPLTELPPCTANNLNYFVCTRSIVSDQQALFTLVSQRVNQRNIMFKYKLGPGGFGSTDEVLLATALSTQAGLNKARLKRSFKMLMNERRCIAKVLFDP